MPLLGFNELEDISPVFRGKVGNVLAEGLVKMLSVDKLNDLYDRYSHLKGVAFADAVLKDVGLEYGVWVAESGSDVGYTKSEDVSNILEELLPAGPFITISNHPCGHLDGVALVDLIGKVRSDYKVMVNKILGRVETMSDNFIHVVPTGAEKTAATEESVRGVKAALRHLRSGGVLGLFPSGAVSDLHLPSFLVRDREWQEPVIKLIAKAQVPIVPIRFFDGNSPFYYSLGLIDWRVRLLRLPAEVFNKKGKPFRIGIGPVITVEKQRPFASDLNLFRSFLRSSVYDMEIGM